MREKVSRYLQLTGIKVDEMATGYAKYVVEQYEAAVPELPAEPADEKQAEMKRSFDSAREAVRAACESERAALAEQIVTSIESLFTETEIDLDKANAFFATDLGQKLVALGPVVMDSMNTLMADWQKTVMDKADLKRFFG